MSGADEDPAGTGDRRMWCDGFDMDLPKVLPHARDLFGPLGARILFTHGATTHGIINGPSAWHTEAGLACFFGRRDPAKPPAYVTREPVVACTVWEAVRDLWAHQHVMIVEGIVCWRPADSWPSFQTLTGHRRGWRPTDATTLALARRTALGSLAAAAAALREVVGR